MKSLIRMMLSLCLALWFTTLERVEAGIINSANVTIGSNSFRSFTDTTTSRQWLDLDNFWDETSTYNSLNSLLAGSGFHLATLVELEALQASIPAISANFSSEVGVLGGNFIGKPFFGTRDLIWGIYADGNSANGVSYSYKYGSDFDWSFGFNLVSPNQTLRSVNSGDRDLGAWVVSDSAITSVPEPSSIAIFGVGALGCCFVARRKNART